jgi:hypothetical protein
MITIILKPTGEPSGIDQYPSISTIQTPGNAPVALSATATPNIADQVAAMNAIGSASMFRISYSDVQGAQQSRVVIVADIQTIL